jgi:rRNA maturation protein Nop10
MVETTCPTCGGKRLEPDPPQISLEEKIAFRKAWDARFEESK